MKLTVYLDMLILINTLINYFLRKTAAAAAKISYNVKRLIISAIIGALFSTIIFMENSIGFAASARAVAMLLCTYIAFGFVNKRYYLRNLFYLTAVNVAFTGVMYAFFGNSDFLYINNLFFYININPVLLVVCVCVVYFVISVFDFFFENRQKASQFEFDIYFEDEPVKLAAFYDTGFNIRDIISRKAVMLCCFADVENRMPEKLAFLIREFISGRAVTSALITPVFYSDITAQGMLPAIKPSKVIYKNRKIENVLIAFTGRKLSQDVQIIFGKEILNMTGD